MPKISQYSSPRDGVAAHIVGYIDRCEEHLDVAVYSLTHDAIRDALIRAHQRGVRVRVLTDKVQAAGRGADDEALEAAGIEVRRDVQSGLMHHKFAVDGRNAVLKGSFNWSRNADERNAEYWEVNRYKYVIDWLQRLFDELWIANDPSGA